MRGSLPGLLEAAAEIASSRLSALMDALDRASSVDAGTPFGGPTARVTRADHLILLARDEDYQKAVLSKMQFATDAEKAQLKRDLLRVAALFPEHLPAEVAQVAGGPAYNPNEAPPLMPTMGVEIGPGNRTGSALG